MLNIDFKYLEFWTYYSSKGTTNKNLAREYCFSKIFYGKHKQNNDYELYIYNDGHIKTHDNNCLLTKEQLITHIEEINKFYNGIQVEDYIATAKEVQIINNDKKEVLITISQGKNRQVRKMFDAIGYPVVYLRRVAIGNIVLGNLPLGKWRHLNPNEVKYLLGK